MVTCKVINSFLIFTLNYLAIDFSLFKIVEKVLLHQIISFI